MAKNDTSGKIDNQKINPVGEAESASLGNESGTGGNSNSEATEAATTKRKRVRARKAAAEAEQPLEQDIPLIIPVTIPGEETSLEPVKPVRKRKTKKDQSKETAELCNTILGVGFDMLASRAGDHWRITEEEAEAITTPLLKILDRLQITEKVEKYGDWAALALGLGTVVAPRAMISIMSAKENKKHEQQGKPVAADVAANVERNRNSANYQDNNNAAFGSALV